MDRVRRLVYTLRRIKDTNGDGTVDSRDRATLWRVTGDGRAASRLPLSWPPLAVSSSGTLAAGDSRHLFLLPLQAPKAIPLPAPPGKILRVWFTGKNTLNIRTGSGGLFTLAGGVFKPANTFRLLPGKLRISLSGGKKILTGQHAQWRFPLTDRGSVWEPLFPLQPGLIVLLRVHPNPAVYAVAMRSGRWNRLYGLPPNTTRIRISADRATVLYLTTWDTDKNGRREPQGLDKSAISFLRIIPGKR